MKEEWRVIKGYEGLYEVSNKGRIKSLAKIWFCGGGRKCSKPDTILIISSCGRGYMQVGLCKNGKVRTKKVAPMVWDAFGDRSRNGRKLQVDHKNNDKSDNRICNLQLLTQRENCSKGKLNYKKTSRYTGVSWDKYMKRWVSHIQKNGKTKSIGYFLDEHEAHLAYQEALKELDEH